MELTAYELADLSISMQASTTPTTGLVLTLASGYLITAWLVGQKLTRTQVVLTNLLFTSFQFIFIAGWGARWMQTYKYYERLQEIDPTLFNSPPTALLIALGILMVFSVLACLYFMWHVRRQEG